MKKGNLRIAVSQINCAVGDLEGNTRKIKDYIVRAQGLSADIVCFPELSVTGYPPEDLLIKPKFVADNLKKIKELAEWTRNKDIVPVIGFVDKQGKEIYNAAAVIYNGRIKGIYRKTHLPNYGVFDEKRYFGAGRDPAVFNYGGFVFGVNICEDIWHFDGPAKEQAEKGARLIININSSPFHSGKIKERKNILGRQAVKNDISIVYANAVGGQDELVFDGRSMAVDNKGRIIVMAEPFKEQMPVVDIELSLSAKAGKKGAIDISDKISVKEKPPLKAYICPPLEPVAEVYQALLLGIKDYVGKNGFHKVVIGLSGGIDSSLAAVLAADSLGKDNVIGVFMPSRYTSVESEKDTEELVKNLGIELLSIPMEGIFKVYLDTFSPIFAGLEKNITEENLQARIRGNILMALSNKFGWLVLTTGNKSEMSTGYATLYGDMAGGFAVIKDASKTLVYKLAEYRNSLGTVIPGRVIAKAPTAELKLNQKDSDTLPEYGILDPILKAYIEEDEDPDKIISLGFDRDIVSKVSDMVDKSEYKRRQSPPGIKITPRAFGRDRRMPITNKYRS